MYGMDVEKIMRLIDFKHHVQDKLYSIYNQNECDIIFYELIENFLGISKINYLVDMEHLILDSEILILNQKINQLKSNEPLQYVIGNKKIFGINFKLNDSALIPRPETEELCSWILSHILNDIKILDIGTGSGLIALVLKKHVKNSKVDGWDNSIKALNLAKSNAKKNNYEIIEVPLISIDRIKFGNSTFNLLSWIMKYLKTLTKSIKNLYFTKK